MQPERTALPDLRGAPGKAGSIARHLLRQAHPAFGIFESLAGFRLTLAALARFWFTLPGLPRFRFTRPGLPRFRFAWPRLPRIPFTRPGLGAADSLGQSHLPQPPLGVAVSRDRFWLVQTVLGITESLIRFWLIRGPRLVAPWSPTLADALEDGAWMARWRGLSAFLPLLAFAVGFLMPLTWADRAPVATEALAFKVLVVAGAIVSGPVGLMAASGFVLGDLAGTPNPGQRFAAYGNPFAAVGSQAISYLLVGIPALHVPRVANTIVRLAPLPRPGGWWTSLKLRVLLYPLSSGLLTFMWCQGMNVLARPVTTTWGTGLPTIQAIQDAPRQWAWIVGAAVVAAVARVALEHAIGRQSRATRVAALLHRLRRTGAMRRGVTWGRLPLPVRILVPAGLITLLLSGAYSDWMDAATVGAATLGLETWRATLGRGIAVRMMRLTQCVPPLLRFAIPPLLGTLVATGLSSLGWDLGAARSGVLGALVTLLTFVPLFPRASVRG